MENTKITIVCENTAGMTKGLLGEHGFCALLEKNNEKILVDTGQGFTLKTNAKILKINLSHIRTIVLSHGHFDHTGGLAHLVSQKEKINIHAHPDIFAPKYSLDEDKKPQFVGTGLTQEYFESSLNAVFHFHTDFTQISKDVYFSGVIPRQTEFEQPDKRLLVQQGQGFIQDPLADDASLLIETSSGPVILTGCAHSGIVNIMNHFSRKTGHKSFYAVMGGTHLGFLNSDIQLEKTMDAFDQFNVQLIAVSHCTGNKAAAACYNRFKHRFAFAGAGWSAVF